MSEMKIFRMMLTLVFVFAATSISAQTVKGVVKDVEGEPVIGATVMEKGTKNGTTTDLNGNFTLNVSGKAPLEISYVGMKSQTVSVAGKSSLNVKLENDAANLDDLVVIGYGTVKKRDLTGAVASVKSEDITIAPTSDAMEALQGRVAGLDITKTSGQLGDDVSIILRGSRSIYSTNETTTALNAPLFIIDGFVGSYNEVNPADIESIEVLKDASSTAIYGAAGANGVVLITTKRGKADRVTVNFDAYYGFSGKPNYKHGMTGNEWMDYQRESYKYQHGTYPANPEALFQDVDYLNAYNQGKWIDWVDKLTDQTATTQKYNLSVTSGGDKTKVFASANYSKDTGLLSGEERNRYGLRLNVDQKVFKWLQIGMSSQLTYTNQDRSYNKSYTGSLSAFPLGDVYDGEGNIIHEYMHGQYSPLSDFIKDQYVNSTRSTYVNANGYIQIDPLPGLTLKSSVAGTLSHSRLGNYWGNYCNANRPNYAGSPYAEKTHNDAWNYMWQNVISYTKTIADAHTFGLTGISEWQKNQSELTMAGETGQLVDSWSFHKLANATYVKSEFYQTQKMSYAIRFNYDYKGRYLFSFSNRWDGMSWFIDGEKWSSFPAVAVAWRISDEPFMASANNWLDNLKLRIGYGVTGNPGSLSAYVTSPQAYLYPQWGVTKDGTYVPFAQYTGTYGGSLTWEKSYNWNFGLDFALLNGRIDGSIEYFTTKTDGLLFARQLPITSGITGWGSPLKSWQNLAKTSNHGLELAVNSRNIVTKDFKWTTNFTAAWEKEQIDELPNGDIIAESLFEGSPIHTVYGYKYDGIWGTDASQEELDTYGVKPGFVKIETVENEGDGGKHKYSDKDRMILGHENPNWVLGLNNTFEYKGFDLSLYVMGRFGQTISSKLLGWYQASNSITKNQLSGIDYWTEDNQGAYYPRPGTGEEQSAYLASYSICDGSFIKIKNITLGYTLPKAISKKAMLERARIYFTAYNPLIFTFDKQLRKADVDPETMGSDVYPTYGQFVFGVNLTF